MNKKLIVAAIMICFMIIFVSVSIINKSKYIIKTDYGDTFEIQHGLFGDAYYISDRSSDFGADILLYRGKEDLKSICDTERFRCYEYVNGMEDKYFCKLKSTEEYTIVVVNCAPEYSFFSEDNGRGLLENLLSDSQIMKICLNWLDEVYHDEIMDMAQKLTSGNYEGLDKYGLTEEMINDKESLEEKIGIMEEYLKENSIQPETASSEK